jgi:hypothetical protein
MQRISLPSLESVSSFEAAHLPDLNQVADVVESVGDALSSIASTAASTAVDATRSVRRSINRRRGVRATGSRLPYVLVGVGIVAVAGIVIARRRAAADDGAAVAPAVDWRDRVSGASSANTDDADDRLAALDFETPASTH